MKTDKSVVLDLAPVHDLNLKGLKAAVIGGTGGVGRALSHLLAEQGAEVIVVGQTFRDAGKPGISFLKADLSLMKEARRIGRELPAETLDMVVMTTGVMAGPKREVTAEGIEKDMAVSYLSRLVLLRELAPRLGTERVNASFNPRLFIMGFPGSGQKGTLGDLNSEASYNNWAVHSNTVAGNEVAVLEGAEQYRNVDIFGLNPGFVKTNIRANLFGKNSFLKGLLENLTGFMTISPETYAERLVPLLVSPQISGQSGMMFDNKARAILPTPQATDSAYAQEFLRQSDAILAAKV